MVAAALNIDRRTQTTEDWHRKSAARWLAVCRATCDSRLEIVKSAEIGSSLSVPFEQAFSNLAHSIIAEKAPKFLEYEQGFQLLDKSEDGTRAVGIFGFKIGNQWIYVPAFFLNGELKGMELSYIKNQDLFVPFKENWVNYLQGRKPNLLGREVNRNLSHLGVLSPNLYQLSRSPYKVASDSRNANSGQVKAAMPNLASWAVDFLPVLAKIVLTKVAFEEPKLPAALCDAGMEGFGFLKAAAEQYPTVFQAVERFYGIDCLRKVAADIGTAARLASGDSIMQRLHKQASPRSMRDLFAKRAAKDLPDVEVIVRRDVYNGNAPDMKLSDTERTQLTDEGRIVRDKRPDSAISKVYNLSNSFKLQTPGETGLYDILVKPDKFEKCLVLMAPYAENGRERFCTVVSLEGEKKWTNIHPTRVFFRSQYSQGAWHDWFDKLDDAKDLPVSKSLHKGGPLVMLIGRAGNGTTPLRASDKIEGPEGEGATYSVRFDDYCNWDRKQSGLASSSGFATFAGFNREGPVSRYVSMEDHPSIRSIRLTGREGAAIRAGREELYVPGTFKKLVVEPDDPENSVDGADDCDSGRAGKRLIEPDDPDKDVDDDDDDVCDSGRSKKKLLQPGNLADFLFAIQSSLPPLRVSGESGRYSLNGAKLDKDAAFKHLVTRWGLRADTADLLIKTADDKPRSVVEYHVKLAGPYLTEGGGPGAPGLPEEPYSSDHIMNSQMPMQMPFDREVPVESMRPNPADREQYRPTRPDQESMQMSADAAQTGQKEVFDTAMLGSLLNTVRQSSMIDRYLGDLMKGLDRLGRIYFQYLWHGKEFEDRFGASELPELEDGIVNVFEGLGDIVLKLKQKSAEPMADTGTDVDLSGIANQ